MPVTKALFPHLHYSHYFENRCHHQEILEFFGFVCPFLQRQRKRTALQHQSRQELSLQLHTLLLG
jgi:hypothetical protein